MASTINYAAAQAKLPQGAPAPSIPTPPPDDPGANFLRSLAAGQNPYGQTQMPGYTGAFQSALDAARGNIADQLHGALADISNSNAKAGQALQQYAPMVNNDWQEGQATDAGALASIAGANGAAGVGPVNNGVLGGGRLTGNTGAMLKGEMAPDMAAQAATHREDLSDQALLGTGIQQMGEHENALAQLQAQQDNGTLDQAQMSYAQAQDAAAQQQGYAQQNALQAFQYGLLTNAQQAKLQAAATAAANKTAVNNNPATGPYATYGLTQSQVNSVHADPKYGRFISFLNDHPGDPNAMQMAVQLSSGDPNFLSALEAEGYIPKGTAGGVIDNSASSSKHPYGKSVSDNIRKSGSVLNQIANASPFGVLASIKNSKNGESNLSRGAKRVGSWFNPFG